MRQLAGVYKISSTASGGRPRAALRPATTIGRSARNVNAKVILYADKVTESIQSAIDETLRRRQMQEEYNREHGITPATIRKAIRAGIESDAAAHAEANAAVGREADALRDRIREMRARLKGEPVPVGRSADKQKKTSRRRGRKGSHIPRPKRS